jgi:hypothetical protein
MKITNKWYKHQSSTKSTHCKQNIAQQKSMLLDVGLPSILSPLDTEYFRVQISNLDMTKITDKNYLNSLLLKMN